MVTGQFRLETKIIGRKAKDRNGQAIPGRQSSVVAKAAYRSGQVLHDERAEKTFNLNKAVDLAAKEGKDRKEKQIEPKLLLIRPYPRGECLGRCRFHVTCSLRVLCVLLRGSSLFSVEYKVAIGGRRLRVGQSQRD
jgi:hypothetical protein